MGDVLRRHVFRLGLPSVLAIVLAIKLGVLAIDSTIRIYLGDSAAYLWGAMDEGQLPDDRSFTYSLIIRAVAWPSHSLRPIVEWQSIAGVIAAALLWMTLVRGLAIPPRRALLATVVLALEPAQLYYERMILAESLGLLAFAGSFATAVAYVTSWRVGWLVVTAVFGLVAASLRINYLPVVMVISVTLPLLARLAHARVAGRMVIRHVAVALIVVAALHGAYTAWVGSLFGVAPTYLARGGLMRLGLVMPLVTPEHLARVGLPADLSSALQYPLADPHARMVHLWDSGGLVRELTTRDLEVERIASDLSRMAIFDNPLGLIRLGLYTVGDFFRGEQIETALYNDLGRRVIPDEVLWTLREKWGYDATELHTRATVVSRYFEWGTSWLVMCLFLTGPLSLWVAVTHWPTPQRVPAILVALFGCGLVLAHVLFVPVALYRYLHPLPFFALASLCAVHRRPTLGAE